MKTKARIGLYTTGLKAYWPQFAGMRERLEGYGRFIEGELSAMGDVEVFNFGLVDCSEKGIEAGEYFQRNLVDIVFQHIGTYVTSDSVLPVHQICKAPTVILNLQPAIQVNYAKTTTGEWLAHCNACPAPEIANAFNRAGIRFRVVSGLLGLRETPAISVADETTCQRPEAIRAWREIRDWTRAAAVKASLSRARFGFLGNNYSGMLDMYSDFTMLQGGTGIHVELLEMCDLAARLAKVTDADVKRKLDDITSMFEISEDSPSDPRARTARMERPRRRRAGTHGRGLRP